MEQNRQDSSARRLLFRVGVPLLAAALAWVAAAVASRALDRYHHRVKVRQAASLLVSKAVLLAQQAVETNSEAFRQFVLSRTNAAHAFAEEATSLYGKWRAVKPRLPGTDPEGHQAYIRDLFEKHVLSREELATALRRSIEGWVKDVDDIQNDLAVKLRQEMAGGRLGEHEMAVAQQDFRAAIHRLVAGSPEDPTREAGNLVSSQVASWVAMRVFARLGVEAGVLAVGAADAWWTLGASLVVGLIVDVVWRWIDNPVGKIENEVNQSLDKVAREGKAALTAEMGRLVTEKQKLWEAAATDMVKQL